MPFKKGKSGNSMGRPKGSGSRQILFNSLVAPRKEQLVDTAIQLALNGNESMLKLFLERLIPAKQTDEPLEHSLEIDGSLAEQGQKVLKLMACGQLSISDGLGLIHGYTAQTRLIESSELVQRLDRLEGVLNKHEIDRISK